ncbi:hypothetical protein ISS42_02955 [Candidatus Shapirobacteria bacterium]|nr:hypothetical protein [Candidatus Shapirobacteria bacterium]
MLEEFSGDESVASEAVVDATLRIWRQEAKFDVSLGGDPALNGVRGYKKIRVAGVKIQPPRFSNKTLAEEGVRGAIEGAQALANKYGLSFRELLSRVVGEEPE